MPRRGARPRRVTPMGVCDAIDGTESFAGAMAQLGNLIPQPNARGVFVPRPAMTELATLPDYGGGPVTLLEGVGNTFYGMVASEQFQGVDAPFVYEPDGHGFIPISGLLAGLLPASQPTTGEWVPPTFARAGGRSVFTHPGFPGGTTTPPVAMLFISDMVVGFKTLRFGIGAGRVFPLKGSLVSADGLPLGTKVATEPDDIVISTTATGTVATNTFTVASVDGLYKGMTVQGPGLYSVVVNITGTTILVNVFLQQNLAGDTVTFYGSFIEMTEAAEETQAVLTCITSVMAKKFGWLDSSGFNVTILGNTNGAFESAPMITGGFDAGGIEPGMTITGPNLVGGKGVVQQVKSVNFVATCAITAGSTGAALIQSAPASAIAAGMTVSGLGILPNTIVLSYAAGNQAIKMSRAALSTNQEASLTFSGSILIIDQPTTGGADNQDYTIAGGTPTAPLWGAGDLNIHPIGSDEPPVFVAEFSGRAYYGVNAQNTVGVQASDAGAPCTQTFANQTLLFESGVPVTSAVGLPLATTAGGIIQALLVFQGDSAIQQITGDFSTANIGVNALQIATGSLSANSFAATPRGVLFVATDGVRLVNFAAVVSDPLGENGHGLVLPFINAGERSRITASFNENVYRVTVTWRPSQPVQSVWGAAERTDEFWLHFPAQGRPLEELRWSGPHTSILDLSAAWPHKSGFLVAPQAARGKLYRSEPKPTNISAYVEFNEQLRTVYETLLLPDNNGFVHAAVETTLWAGLLTGSEEILATAVDDFGQQLDQTYVWISAISLPAHRSIPWHVPLVYRQMRLRIEAGATPLLQLGMVVIHEQQLGYQLPYPVPQEFILNQDALGGFTVLGA